MQQPEPNPVPPRLLEESAEELYEEAPCGYLTTTVDDTIVRVNATFAEWTGYARDELSGRRFTDLLTPGGRIYHETHIRPLLQMQDAVFEIALEMVRADGQRLPILVNSALKRDEHGRPAAVRTTIFNATDRQKYERELLHARRRERAARERTERLQRLTASLASAQEPDALGRLLVRELVQALEVGAAVLAVVDVDGTLRVIARHGGPDPALPALDEALEPRFEEPEGGGGTRAVVPLVAGSRTVAILVAQLAPASTLTPEEQAFMVACAGQCAQALERARLRRATEEAAARAAFLAELGRALDEAPGVQDRADRLVAQLTAAFAQGALVRVLPFDDTQEPVEARSGTLPPDAAALLDRARAGRYAPLRVRDGFVVPLAVRGRRLGALLVLVAPDRRSLAGGDLRFIADLADRAALAVENSRLFEHERTVAHELQRSLVETEPIADPRFERAAHYQAGVRTLEVGGDWHDGFWLSEDRFGLVVGDVVGRGLRAASAMGQLRSALRALAGTGMGPGRVFEHLDTFVDQVAAARMATAAYVEVDLATGTTLYASAGHPPPFLLPRAGDARFLWDGRSAPLGAYAGVTPRPQGEVALGTGDRLLLYTDGLVERRYEALDAGLERLRAVVAAREHLATGPLIDAVTRSLLEDAPDDDACLLCFELRRRP